MSFFEERPFGGMSAWYRPPLPFVRCPGLPRAAKRLSPFLLDAGSRVLPYLQWHITFYGSIFFNQKLNWERRTFKTIFCADMVRL